MLSCLVLFPFKTSLDNFLLLGNSFSWHLYVTDLEYSSFEQLVKQFRSCFMFYCFLLSFHPSFLRYKRKEQTPNSCVKDLNLLFDFENRWKLQQWLLSIFLALQQLLHLQSKRSFLSHHLLLLLFCIYYYCF